MISFIHPSAAYTWVFDVRDPDAFQSIQLEAVGLEDHQPSPYPYPYPYPYP